MKTFKLPDLGEGLQEAEIREWLVEVGDVVKADQPLASVETDKAVVEVPSPHAGKVAELHGNEGDTVAVGAVLVSFEGEPESQGRDTAESDAIRDTGVVVGDMTQGDDVIAEKAGKVGSGAGLKVAPAVRAMAHKLGVDLGIITPTGPNGLITAADVQRVHKILSEVGPLERIRGARRSMANTMSQARDEVMPTTLMDDADIGSWKAGQDVTCRLIRAMVAGVQHEPSLNAWFDPVEIGRRVLEKIHVGVAVDTPEGLFVCVLQDVAKRDAASLREGLDRMKADADTRSVPLEELRGYTISLSNFGRFGGRYATPVIVPPTVAIVAAGSARRGIIVADGKPAVRRILPLSLTFDHRAVTGGEAGRFLAAMIEDLKSGT